MANGSSHSDGAARKRRPDAARKRGNAEHEVQHRYLPYCRADIARRGSTDDSGTKAIKRPGPEPKRRLYYGATILTWTHGMSPVEVQHGGEEVTAAKARPASGRIDTDQSMWADGGHIR
ncbi:hypothetical protein KCP78_21625 [Salmonella enterica subsp. enterica]|nr:hypothetical protein KCP78_21625 [Salmonella enterica subsp. enterica]